MEENEDYKKRYIKIIEQINIQIRKTENDIRQMKTYFENADNDHIREKEDRIKAFEDIKERGKTTINDLSQVIGEEHAYQEASVEMYEKYLLVK